MDRGKNEAIREDFMRKAVDKAREGISKAQAPFAACIVKDDEIVSCEHNRVWQETDSTMHAEVHAIRVAERRLGTIDLSGCTIYSTTEPCPMCFSAIHWAKIDQIVYGTSISDARELGFSELTISNLKLEQLGQSPVRVLGGLLKEENQRLFDDWSSRSDRRVF